ncbi:hypothetical protein EV193_102114 [Herbihabitans rhizosphaerae]|uniref:Uncharacterized protein n=1 Tax=Herbihabitans rhizosphaerae TaxID=1872711 RepID=A0A4Q7L0Y0_9PSEU|nr:hypothetical protein EV193_102114 [Herbihabitans rhizosphaerae]
MRRRVVLGVLVAILVAAGVVAGVVDARPPGRSRRSSG